MSEHIAKEREKGLSPSKTDEVPVNKHEIAIREQRIKQKTLIQSNGLNKGIIVFNF